jgi:hypothetical protein
MLAPMIGGKFYRRGKDVFARVIQCPLCAVIVVENIL